MKKTYLKKENGVTMVALIITIIVMIILAGVGISAVLPNGLIEKAEEISKNNSKREVIEQIYSEFDYKYYYVFGEELSDNEALVEKIYNLSMELNLPVDTFAINYAIDFENMEVDKTQKQIYYRYDKVVSRKEEDSINYEYKEGEDYSVVYERLGPNAEEQKKLDKLEEKGIKILKCDMNFDGLLTKDDVNRLYEIINYINLTGLEMWWTNVELAVADIYEDEWIDEWSEIYNLNEILILIDKEEE